LPLVAVVTFITPVRREQQVKSEATMLRRGILETGRLLGGLDPFFIDPTKPSAGDIRCVLAGVVRYCGFERQHPRADFGS
jgi:hypothetical protein